MVKGKIGNLFKKKDKSYKEIQESGGVYNDPLQQHGIRRVTSQPDDCIYSDVRTKARYRRAQSSVTDNSPTQYSAITSHTAGAPAHNPNYMFQDPYEIPISTVNSTEEPAPPLPYMNDIRTPERLPEAHSDDDDDDIEVVPVDQNIHSLCKNGIGGLYQNIETVEVKETFNLFGGYEDVWSSESAKKSLYKNLHDDDMAMSNPELTQIVDPVPKKPARRYTGLQQDKPKLSIKYATPPLPVDNSRDRCTSASQIKRHSRPPELRRDSAPVLTDVEPQKDSAPLLDAETRRGSIPVFTDDFVDENTPPPIQPRSPTYPPRSPASYLIDETRERASSWNGREKKVDLCNSDDIVKTSTLELAEQRWFFGPFTRLRAEVRLNGTPPSTFLVRVSTNDNSTILSLMLTGGSVAHIKLHTTDEGVSLFGSNKVFTSVPVMIANYTTTPITLRQLGMQQILSNGLVSMR